MPLGQCAGLKASVHNFMRVYTPLGLHSALCAGLQHLFMYSSVHHLRPVQCTSFYAILKHLWPVKITIGQCRAYQSNKHNFMKVYITSGQCKMP